MAKIDSKTMTVTLSVREYENLLSQEKLLDCLFAAGVESWDKWEIAQDFLNSGELHVV